MRLLELRRRGTVSKSGEATHPIEMCSFKWAHRNHYDGH
jgi:hypothetical protein